VIKRHYDNGWHRGWHGDMGSRRMIVERHDRAFIAATIGTEKSTTRTTLRRFGGGAYLASALESRSGAIVDARPSAKPI
jgi:hypothetical protein